MGWDGCYNARHWKYSGLRRVVDRKRELDDLFTWTRKDELGNVISSGEVLKSAMCGSTYYAAIRDAKGVVWGLVCLTRGASRHDGTIWGYKAMGECEGPHSYDCPASILDLLTPPEGEYAQKWRAKCRERIAAKASLRKSGPAPLFVPRGVYVEARRGSWIIGNGSVCYRFAKRAWHDFDSAMCRFLKACGTSEQKAEYAATGRPCPAEWKEVAA